MVATEQAPIPPPCSYVVIITTTFVTRTFLWLYNTTTSDHWPGQLHVVRSKHSNHPPWPTIILLESRRKATEPFLQPRILVAFLSPIEFHCHPIPFCFDLSPTDLPTAFVNSVAIVHWRTSTNEQHNVGEF